MQKHPVLGNVLGDHWAGAALKTHHIDLADDPHSEQSASQCRQPADRQLVIAQPDIMMLASKHHDADYGIFPCALRLRWTTMSRRS
jgi:hypothetical protein